MFLALAAAAADAALAFEPLLLLFLLLFLFLFFLPLLLLSGRSMSRASSGRPRMKFWCQYDPLLGPKQEILVASKRLGECSGLIIRCCFSDLRAGSCRHAQIPFRCSWACPDRSQSFMGMPRSLSDDCGMPRSLSDVRGQVQIALRRSVYAQIALRCSWTCPDRFQSSMGMPRSLSDDRGHAQIARKSFLGRRTTHNVCHPREQAVRPHALRCIPSFLPDGTRLNPYMFSCLRNDEYWRCRNQFGRTCSAIRSLSWTLNALPPGTHETMSAIPSSASDAAGFG